MQHLRKKEQYLCQLGLDVLELVENSPLKHQKHPAERLLDEIISILDDTSLDDPDCFYRSDAIVRAFQTAGFQTKRHWELD